MVIVYRKEKASVTEDMIAHNQKTCTDCKTTKTPLWRVGPAGPKTLCNACGIKYRKRKVPPVKEEERKGDLGQCNHSDGATTPSASSSASTGCTGGKASFDGDSNFSFSSKIRLKALDEEIWLQRSPPIVKRQRFQKRKLGEEEQAAFCLMALSSGYVFAQVL